MGLLSRLGKAIPRISDDISMAGADAVLGTAGGGALGALSGLGAPNELTPRTLAGAALGGGAAGVFGMRRVVMALAQQMKRLHPNVSDEEIIRAAEEAVKFGGQG